MKQKRRKQGRWRPDIKRERQEKNSREKNKIVGKEKGRCDMKERGGIRRERRSQSTEKKNVPRKEKKARV